MPGQLVSAEWEGGPDPMWRVFARHGLPTSEPRATEALTEMDPGKLRLLMEEVRAERQTIRPLTPEELDEAHERAAQAEVKADEARAERKQLAADIRQQYGDTLLARKAAAQFGVGLDVD